MTDIYRQTKISRMALAAPLLEEIASFAREAVQAPPSSEEKGKAAKERWLSSVEDVASRGRRLKERTGDLRERLTRFVEALALDPRGVDLDEVIDTLRSTEQDTKAVLAPVINRMKATRKGTFSMHGATPGERARAIAAVDKYVAELNESLELLRDFRWKIMTIRADQEDPGDAPVFDDPEKLTEYLKVHSR